MALPERGSVFEATQIGVETTPGTRVPALKRLLSTSLSFAPQEPITPYRPQGSMAPTSATKGKTWTQGAMDGRVSFNDLAYLLAAILCKPVISTPGGATNTRRYTFKPSNWQPDAVQTYSMERGSYAGAERAAYVLIDALTMRFNDTEAAVTGTIMGQTVEYGVPMSTNELQTVNLGGATGGTFKLTFGGQQTAGLAFNAIASLVQTALEGLSTVGVGNVAVAAVAGGYSVTFQNALGQRNVAALTLDATLLTGGGATSVTETTPGAAPADVPEVVADSDKIAVYMGADVGSLARVRRVQAVEWSCADRFSPVFELQDDTDTYAGHVQRGPTLGGQLTMQRNADCVALIEAMRAKEVAFWRLLVTGPDVEPGFPHRLQITWPALTNDPRHGSANDVETGQLSIFPIYDAGFAGWTEVVIDNGLSAL